MLGYGLVGAAVAVLLFMSVRDMLPARESVVVESAPVAAPEGHAVSEPVDSAEEERQSDVAKERAALDALPEE